MRTNILNGLFAVGAVMVLAGAAAYITRWPLTPYIYMVGAVMVTLAQALPAYEDGTATLRRLRRQQRMGGLFLIVSGLCMLFTHGNEWVVALSIAAVLQLYTAIRIPQEEAKDKNQKNRP